MASLNNYVGWWSPPNNYRDGKMLICNLLCKFNEETDCHLNKCDVIVLWLTLRHSSIWNDSPASICLTSWQTKDTRDTVFSVFKHDIDSGKDTALCSIKRLWKAIWQLEKIMGLEQLSVPVSAWLVSSAVCSVFFFLFCLGIFVPR